MQANVDLMNQNVSMEFYNNTITDWLGYRLAMIGPILLCNLAFLLVVLPFLVLSRKLHWLFLIVGQF